MLMSLIATSNDHRGIHGDPDVAWDGVTNPTDDPADPFRGWWCAHNRPTFATWHRPYLALFEVCFLVRVADTSGN